ncbi:MAG: DUF1802 family protein [Methanobacterium sp.]
MEETNQCVKEWKATIEALGQGKQNIFIRVYPTNKHGFLLYPTTNYMAKDTYLQGFKKDYQEFVESNSKSGEGVEIKYYANCVAVKQIPQNKISKLNDFHIWTNEHVKSYINGRDAYVWILKVYELEKPVIVPMATGQIYAKIKKNIDLSNMKPVLTQEEFKTNLEKIRSVF